MFRLLMLITTIIFAALLGVRFHGGIVGIITDWRVWVAAFASVLFWSIVGPIISVLFRKPQKEEKKWAVRKSNIRFLSWHEMRDTSHISKRVCPQRTDNSG